jgi:hypothetical protein
MTDLYKDFEKTYGRYISTLTKANERNKVRLFDALHAANISAVTVTFDGEGDSGQIEDIIAYTGDAQAELPKTPLTIEVVSWDDDAAHEAESETLQSAIEDLCYAYLSQQHGGWENNDGAFGEFAIDVTKRTIELEFNGRFSDHSTTSSSF